MHKKLFIPGPVEVREDVLQKMATPMIGHRTKDASALQRGISEKLQTLMYTKNEILLSTSSGSGLMEGAVRSCTTKRAAVFSVGAFGDRWYKMATSNGVPADLISSKPGKPTTPEMVDKALSTGKYDLITITHNETSSGVMNPAEEIAQVLKKYPEVVSVYYVGDFSKEVCTGPHVTHTGILGHFKIIKEESSSAGVRRIKAILE